MLSMNYETESHSFVDLFQLIEGERTQTTLQTALTFTIPLPKSEGDSSVLLTFPFTWRNVRGTQKYWDEELTSDLFYDEEFSPSFPLMELTVRRELTAHLDGELSLKSLLCQQPAEAGLAFHSIVDPIAASVKVSAKVEDGQTSTTTTGSVLFAANESWAVGGSVSLQDTHLRISYRIIHNNLNPIALTLTHRPGHRGFSCGLQMNL